MSALENQDTHRGVPNRIHADLGLGYVGTIFYCQEIHRRDDVPSVSQYQYLIIGALLH